MKKAAVLGVCFLFVAGVAYADGLLLSYGKSLPTLTLKGKKYKVLRKGELGAKDTLIVENVQFESNAQAIIVGIGKGKGSDLDILVTDSKTRQKIDSDVLKDNVPVAKWNTGVTTRRVVDVRLRNAGSAKASYLLLANW